MAEGGLGGGVDLGGIRYSIQLDLTRLQADLDRAEALIRERATRMGALLGQIEPRAGRQQQGGQAAGAGAAQMPATGTAARTLATTVGEQMRAATATVDRAVSDAVRQVTDQVRRYRFQNQVGQQYEMEMGRQGGRIRRAEPGEDIGQSRWSQITRQDAASRLRSQRNQMYQPGPSDQPSVYRAVGPTELENIRRTGAIKSNSTMALPVEQALGLTAFGRTPEETGMYANANLQNEGKAYLLRVNPTPDIRPGYAELPNLAGRRRELTGETAQLRTTLSNPDPNLENRELLQNWLSQNEAELKELEGRIASFGVPEQALQGIEKGANLPYPMTPNAVPAGRISGIWQLGPNGERTELPLSTVRPSAGISRETISQAVTGAPQQRTVQEIEEAINQSLGPIITRQVGQIQDALNEAAVQSIQQAGGGGGGGGGPPTAEGAEGQGPAGPLDRAAQLALQPSRQDRGRARLRGRVIQGLDRASQVQQRARGRVRTLQQMRDASEARQQDRDEGRAQQRTFGDEQARGEAEAAGAGYPVYNVRTRRPVREPRRTALPLSRFLGAQAPDPADALPSARYRQSAQLGSLTRARQQREQRQAELQAQRDARQAEQDRRLRARDMSRQVDEMGLGEDSQAGGGGGGGGGGPATGGRRRTGIGALVGLIEPSRDVSAILRVGSAILGVGLGINVAAGFARQLNKAIADTVSAEIDLERAGRTVVAVMGQQAETAQEVQARALSTSPQTRGTQAEFLAAGARLQPSVERGLLSDTQRQSVLLAGGELARMYNTDLQPAVQAITDAMSGQTQALEQYGVVLTDQNGRLQGIGLTYDQYVQHVTRADAAQTILQRSLVKIAQEHQNVVTSTGGVISATDQLGRNWERLRQQMAGGIKGPIELVVSMVAGIVGGLGGMVPTGTGPVTGLVGGAPSTTNWYGRAGQQPTLGAPGTMPTTPTATLPGTNLPVPGVRQPFGAPQQGAFYGPTATAPQPITPIDPQTYLTQLHDQIGSTDANTQSTLQAATAIDRLTQILGIYEQRGGQYGGIAAALTPYGGALSMTPEQVAAQAQDQAQQIAAQNRRTQIAAANPNATPDELTRLENEAKTYQPEADPRVRAATARITQAQQAQQAIGLATAETGAQQQEAQLAQSNREIAAANKTLDIRRDLVRIDDERAGVLLSQADLQDRITVASRTNLDTEQAVLRARMDELGVTNQLNDIQYGRNEALARVRAYFANQMLGRPQQAIDLNAVVAQVNQSTLEEPQAALDVLHAQRGTELAERPQRQQQLERQMRLNDLDAEQRKLQDQLIPLDALRRAEEARTDAVQRRLQLANLGDEPELNRIRAIANTLQQSGIDADRAMRAAVEQAAGRDPTRDIVGEAIGRAATLPDAARPPQSDVANTVATSALTAAAASMPSVDQIVIQIQGSTSMGPQEIALSSYAGLLQARAHFSGSVAPQTMGAAP